MTIKTAPMPPKKMPMDRMPRTTRDGSRTPKDKEKKGC